MKFNEAVEKTSEKKKFSECKLRLCMEQNIEETFQEPRTEFGIQD